MPAPNNAAKESIALAVFGRWAFIASLVAGFTIGVAVLPIAGNQIVGAAATSAPS